MLSHVPVHGLSHAGKKILSGGVRKIEVTAIMHSPSSLLVGDTQPGLFAGSSVLGFYSLCSVCSWSVFVLNRCPFV